MPRYRVRGARVAEARQQQLPCGPPCALNSHKTPTLRAVPGAMAHDDTFVHLSSRPSRPPR